MSIEITVEEYFDILLRDLPRQQKRNNIGIEPKSGGYAVLWSADLRPRDFETFKKDYLQAEDSLRKWLDTERWLHKRDFSDCWLTVTRSNGDLRMELRQAKV